MSGHFYRMANFLAIFAVLHSGDDGDEKDGKKMGATRWKNEIEKLPFMPIINETAGASIAPAGGTTNYGENVSCASGQWWDRCE
jgi:hypothetical protein